MGDFGLFVIFFFLLNDQLDSSLSAKPSAFEVSGPLGASTFLSDGHGAGKGAGSFVVVRSCRFCLHDVVFFVDGLHGARGSSQRRHEFATHLRV